MLDQLKDFYSNNSTMVIIAIIALVAMVGMFMFKRNTVSVPQTTNTFSDLQLNTEDIRSDSVDGLCDLETGMCYPQNQDDLQVHHEQHMTPEMQQQLMQDHQMMQQQQQMSQEQ
jgi:hypothetical protein